jgi:hypothetical protein
VIICAKNISILTILICEKEEFNLLIGNVIPPANTKFCKANLTNDIFEYDIAITDEDVDIWIQMITE